MISLNREDLKNGNDVRKNVKSSNQYISGQRVSRKSDRPSLRYAGAIFVKRII